jgi:hypothetical protein
VPTLTHLASDLHDTIVTLDKDDLAGEVALAREDGDGGLRGQ